MKKHITRFESLARRLIEGSFARLLGGRLEAAEVAVHLARAIEEHKQDQRAPDIFQIYVHPADQAAILQQSPQLPQELAAYVLRLAQQADLLLADYPLVQLLADEELSRRQLRVTAVHSTVVDEASTQLYDQEAAVDNVRAAVQAMDAFLILDGKKHVPLRRPIINLGRRTDNDIVLDSSAVSRRHAQIRWRYGRFVLYDLANKGSTLVNNAPVTECVLQTGDVITLSNVLLIYGEGRDKPQRPFADADDMENTALMPDGHQ
ncbi:MAG: DUF3662 domain-containing protein [Anaerolineales bacterium]|nr:DUF3662 domain-containing protein [Anaerolineales bacterium]